MSLEAGATIGPYRVLEQIGRGGMATVYKAYQAALARNVAIKVLPAFFAEEPGFRERFQQEAIAVAKLRHPNILQVFDYGEDGGVTYIVSEFIDGGTLAGQLGTALPLDYLTRMLGPIASALDYAHARGVLHRDVKPSNILLARDGTPILSDFGLAKMVGSQPRLTVSGATVGTPEYMAPEQGTGEVIGPAADQYALAIVAYEMLTGKVPYTAETPLAVLIAHMHKPLPLPRSVNPALSEALEQVLLKGLAKAPGDRYPSASEFVRALSDAAREPAAASLAPAAPLTVARRTRPPRALLAGLAALALVVVVGSLALATNVLRPAQPAPATSAASASPAAAAASPLPSPVPSASPPCPPAASEAGSSVCPTSGPVGTIFGAVWCCFPPGAAVIRSLTFPDGRINQLPTGPNAAADGTARGFVGRDLTLPGPYVWTASGGGLTRTVSFTLTR